MDSELKEIIGAKDGILSYVDEVAPVFCKPKLIPLKSITIEKLERMQHEALEKAKEKDENDAKTGDTTASVIDEKINDDTKNKTTPDIWSSEG